MLPYLDIRLKSVSFVVGDKRLKIYDERLKTLLEHADEAPELMDGDVIHMDAVQGGIGAINVLRAITTILTLALLIDRVVRDGF